MATAASLILIGGTASAAGAENSAVQSPDGGLCVQRVDGSARCYDSEAAALDAPGVATRAERDTVSPVSLADCTLGRFCIWEWTDFNSNGLWRWRIGAGTWQLVEGDIMNKGTSAFNHRYGTVFLIDSACPEWVYRLDPGERNADLGKESRPAPCGGNWNNRVDKVRLF
ncbi:hypothetical protein [Streptomyces sp. NPDC020965]|uniref:hypothetical protein n=1 Tax=Streptomyces sp. NPDC020965 TaxID=3365105 RepID=UPI0037AA3029